MKTKSFGKIALLAMSLVLMIGAFFAMTANAATTPEIANINVQYTDKFCLVYAVPADSVSGDSATLHVYEEYPEEGVEPIKSYTVNKTTPAGDGEGAVGLDYEAYVFYTDGVAAMALDKVLYAQVVDAENNASSVKSYSVVEYLYTRLAEVDGVANTDEQNGLYKSVIDFGTYAQKNFLKEAVLAETTLVSDYCYVSTQGCTVNGKTAAVVPQGKAFDVAGDNGALSACTVTTYDTYDTTGTATETKVTGASVTITGSARAHIVAGAAKVYREGTETFEDYEVGVGTPASKWGKLFYGNDNSLRNQTVANDKVYGASSTVFPLKLTVGQVDMFPICSDVTAEEATAFEYSFDIKMDITETLAAYQAAGVEKTPERIGWLFYLVDTSGNRIEKDIVRIFANYGDKLRADISLNYKNYVISDTPASEWHNIRIVFKNPDDATTTVEFYLDGAEEPTVYNLVNYVDINTIGRVKFVRYHDTYDKNTLVYLDNVWCGYTNE